MKSSDKTWAYYGATNPYFGVLTDPEFMSERLTDDARDRFFDSGRRYVDFILRIVREHLDPTFQPTRAVDFGCGVGRLTIPLAGGCESVVGVDVSAPMLEEARSNSRKFGLENVTFVQADDQLSALTGTFDLLNSIIVFQHIPPARGEVIFRKLIDHLRDGGVGALQFTYGFESSTSWARRALIEAYTLIPALWYVRNILKGRPLREPMMQMNRYNLNRLLRILQEADCHSIHVRFTETQSFGHPFYGAILFFQKKRADTKAFA